MNTPQTTAADGNGVGPAAIPPFPVTPVFPALVTSGQVISSTGYGNVVRQALIDLWTDVQHVGQYASEVPATRQIIAGAGLGGGGTLAADVTLTANVRTVFGRTGDVVLTAADITAGGGVPATRQVIAGAGLSGGGDLSGDRTLTVTPDTTNQQVRVSAGGTLAGTRREINFIQGSNVTLAVADDAANNRVNVTITATGGGGASPSNYWVNGALVGTRPTLNLIAGANTTIVGVDNSAGDRVDVTISSAAGGSAQTPWLSDINAAAFSLNNLRNLVIRGDGFYVRPADAGYDWYNGQFTHGTGEWQVVRRRISDGNWTAPFTIRPDGGVGIGTTNPLRGLHYASGLGAAEFLIENTATAFSTPGRIWRVTNAAETTLGFEAMHGDLAAGLRVLTLTPSGNVGIGRAAPNARLDILYPSSDPGPVTGGTATAFSIRSADSVNANGLFAGVHDAATPYGWIQCVTPGVAVRPLALQPAGGNVGIGTGSTPPQTTLHVYGTSDHTVIRVEGTTGYPRLELKSDSRHYQFACGGSAAGSLAGSFYIFDENAAVTRFVINPSGNVGIGTASPGARLQVVGGTDYADSVRVSGANAAQYTGMTSGPDYGYIFHWKGGVWGNLALCKDGGSVGIGTANPGVKLDVAGPFRATGEGDPASGAGVEIKYFPGSLLGQIVSVDRTAGAMRSLRIQGNDIELNASAGIYVLKNITTTPGAANSGQLYRSGNQLLIS